MAIHDQSEMPSRAAEGHLRLVVNCYGTVPTPRSILRSMRHAILLLTLLALPGCFLNRSRINRPLEPAIVASLKPGTSTAADVVTLMGAPVEVVQLGHRSAYRYDYTLQKQAGLFLLILGVRGVESQQDRVWFFFDEHDVLTHVGATFEAKSARYGVPIFK